VEKIVVIYQWCIWLIDDDMVKKGWNHFLLQIFMHMASMIDDKVTWMYKISFENVISTKSFQIWLKNNYANDMKKMMCRYIDNLVIQLFYNDFKSKKKCYSWKKKFLNFFGKTYHNFIWIKQTQWTTTCKELILIHIGNIIIFITFFLNILYIWSILNIQCE
jgi:hypothetical protein